MKKLFLKIEKLRKTYKSEIDFYNKDRHAIAKKLCCEYPNIPIDIMEYYFVKHSNQGLETLTGLQNINAIDINVIIREVKKEDLLNDNIIQNAPFTSYDKPVKYKDDTLKSQYDWYKNEYFKNGSWDYPIITIKEKGKLWVVDGTNRFRHMLICLINNFDFINDKHLVYVLNS